MQRDAEVGDWSWRRTRRRLGELVRLTKPYKRRTALSLGFLLLATGTALLPPALAKFAVDDGIRKHDLHALWWIVAAFVGTGILNWLASSAQTYYTGWGGGRVLGDLRMQPFRHLQRLSPRLAPHAAVLPPAAPLGPLLRAEPRRGDHQPPHKRCRGARPARHRRRH